MTFWSKLYILGIYISVALLVLSYSDYNYMVYWPLAIFFALIWVISLFIVPVYFMKLLLAKDYSMAEQKIATHGLLLFVITFIVMLINNLDKIQIYLFHGLYLI